MSQQVSEYTITNEMFHDWDQITIRRHVNRPYYKCNHDKLNLIKDKRVIPVMEEMVDRIVEKYNPNKIIFFGSQIHGTATVHSDIDLLVLFNKKMVNEFNIGIDMLKLMNKSPYPKDILICNTDKAIKLSKICGNVIYYAIQDGVVVYEH